MGHFYYPDGTPCYTVIAKGTGLPRDTTLADAKKLGLDPSATTVLDICAKPALTQYFVTQAIYATLTLTRNDTETDEEYIARVKRDSKEAGQKAAEEGTRIHDACEQYFKDKTAPMEYAKHVDNVATLIATKYPEINDWISEKSFGHSLGYGGKVDLHSPSTGIVIDFKTKDKLYTVDCFGKKLIKLAYDQNRQLGAYQQGLNLPLNVCANVFIDRVTGEAVLHEWTKEQVSQGTAIFNAVLNVWKLINLGAKDENK